MKIESDEIKIGFGAREADGTKLEPEAQPVVRTAVTRGEMKGSATGEIAGALPVVLEQKMRAGELAQTLRKACCNCAYYSEEAFQTWVRQGLESGQPSRAAEVNDVLRLLEAKNVLTNRLTLAGVGVCRAISSIENSVYVVGGLETDPAKYEGLFKPTDAVKDGVKASDAVLFKASGKL